MSVVSSLSSAQPWLSRSFLPTQSLAASTCYFHPHHFHNHPLPRPSRSFRPTRSLAASWLVSIFHFSTSSPPPGLSRSFRPTQSLAASTCYFHPHHFHNHPLPRPSRSFRPTRSLAASWLVSIFHFSSSSPPPGLSRSFRPTRSVAASILSSTHLSYFSTFALTQSVIPAHSVPGRLSSMGSYSTHVQLFRHCQLAISWSLFSSFLLLLVCPPLFTHSTLVTPSPALLTL